ncbi:MAG: hypothetical protein HPY66_1547 [Firmicutes bacterium]|nr:hypothetical protein [Bacillota bacterium]
MPYTRDLNRSITAKVFILYILAAPLALVLPDFTGMFAGLTLGVLFSVLNFRLLSLTLERAVRMEPRRAAAYAAYRYAFRYFLTGGVLYLSIVKDHINIVGTIIGLLLIKLVILVNNILGW